MRYLLIVGHAGIAEGIVSAFEMLMGSREYVIACGLTAQDGPDQYREVLAERLGVVGAEDDVVVLADVAGGYPVRCALETLASRGMDQRHMLVCGGANLPMVLSAIMGIDDGLGLDAIRDALLAEGTQAVCEIV